MQRINVDNPEISNIIQEHDDYYGKINFDIFLENWYFNIHGYTILLIYTIIVHYYMNI